jgi:hypothetical protein
MRFLFPLLVLSMCIDSAIGALLVSESFDYTPGSRPGNGGSGWKESWGSDPMSTTNTGLTYTDSGGNSLQVAGNASTRKSNGSSQIEAVRDFENEITNTFWFSVLIEGVAGNNTVSLGINESFYVGQGAKDVKSTTWGVYDADKTQLSGVGVSAVNDISLFVGQALYSRSKSKFTQLNLWRNPDLDAQPDASATSSFYSGSIKEFDKIPKIAVYHTSDNAALDELRFGESYADVTSYTSASPSGSLPEPSTFLILSLLIPLAILIHRKQRLALVGHRLEAR